MLHIKSQTKPMPLPLDLDKNQIKWTRGTWRVDERIPEEDAQHYRMRYPDAQWIGSGDYGIATECEPGVICKYTSQPSEAQAARKVMSLGNKPTGTCKIYDVEEINDEVWLIKSEKCRTLNEEEKIVYGMLDIVNGKWDKGDIPEPLHFMADDMSRRFMKMKENLARSGLRLTDAHGDNVGWNKNYDLVLFDLGGSLPK